MEDLDELLNDLENINYNSSVRLSNTLRRGSSHLNSSNLTRLNSNSTSSSSEFTTSRTSQQSGSLIYDDRRSYNQQQQQQQLDQKQLSTRHRQQSDYFIEQMNRLANGQLDLSSLLAKTNERRASDESSSLKRVCLKTTTNDLEENINDLDYQINSLQSLNKLKMLVNGQPSYEESLHIGEGSSRSSSSSHLDDLSELDSLLDDLALAKKQYGELKASTAADSRTSSMQLDAPTVNFRSSDMTPMIIKSATYSVSSASVSPPSMSSMSHTQSHYSSSSPTSSSSNKTSNDTTNHTDESIELNTFKATKELEDLMNSLSMYKKNEPDNGRKKKSTSYSSSLRPTKTKLMHSSVSEPGTMSITNKNFCFSCQQEINGQVITALGYLWHPEHFLCTHCHKSIGTSIFYEKDNRPYCEEDYLALFSPKCAACTLPILDKMLTALNQTWHISCFTCFSCMKMLNEESFMEINNRAYCKNCYGNNLAPKCKKCNEAITDNFISAVNGYWHPNCFVCTQCAMPFNSSSFYEYENMPYCEMDYHAKRGSLCAACNSPINGRCVTAMNKKYHPDHFTCSFCLKPLSSGTFKEHNDKSFCHACYFKLFS